MRHLTFWICSALISHQALAEPIKLDHHGRWVTAALLSETLNQEQNTVKQLKLSQPKYLATQVYFANQLAQKIKYRPSTEYDYNGPAPKKIDAALNQLPQWNSWSHLKKPETKLIPLCREQSSSHECKSFRALRGQSIDQLKMISQLHLLAQQKPKSYSQTNTQCYHALLLLRQKQYAESLRVLFDLQTKDPKFKLLYNKIQRIYSLNQKAQGEVVLRQTL